MLRVVIEKNILLGKWMHCHGYDAITALFYTVRKYKPTVKYSYH